MALDDCSEIFGDTLARTVTWKQGADVSKLAGQAVRLHFELSDADLYSFRLVTAAVPDGAHFAGE